MSGLRVIQSGCPGWCRGHRPDESPDDRHMHVSGDFGSGGLIEAVALSTMPAGNLGVSVSDVEWNAAGYDDWPVIAAGLRNLAAAASRAADWLDAERAAAVGRAGHGVPSWYSSPVVRRLHQLPDPPASSSCPQDVPDRRPLRLFDGGEPQ